MASNGMDRRYIKTAREEDIDRVQELYNNKQVKKELHWYTYREGLERAVRRDGRNIFYVEEAEDKEVIGASMVWCESRVLGSNKAQVRLIAVHPEYRGLSLGTDLINASQQYAEESGKDILIAETALSSDAMEFWLAMDFEITSTRTTDSGREMALMEKLP